MPSVKKVGFFVAGIALGAFIGIALFNGGIAKAASGVATQVQHALGTYVLMQHSNTTATPGVFRMNQATGAISYCFMDPNGRSVVTCTAETQ